jgi:5-(carboxyamino)imidazole ribonucleotide mutase
MKIFVVFGSKSDENISLPLVNALSKDFAVEYEPISAHRELEKLEKKMKDWKGDIVIAGAGLAAALPGVVAAMTGRPVFGVPVPSQFGGLDSFASIAQMPPGVPVITCGPITTDPIVGFLKQYKSWEKAKAVHFISVLSHPDLLAEIEKAKTLGAEKGLTVTFSAEKKSDALNVIVVTKPEDVRKDEFCLHMPFLPKEEAKKPAAYVPVVELANKGGLWVGVNNTRNAVQSVLRLAG